MQCWERQYREQHTSGHRKTACGDIHPDVPVSPPGGISTIGSIAVLK